MDGIKKEELLTFAGYQEFEAAADRTAVKIKEGYMEMGYILKMARDTDILTGSGYAGYEEFADKRYGLDKGTVSRYIRIVERFSVDGNSHVLKDNYRNMGFAKLSIMLHMPDAIAEELMDTLSKTEVQAIREELEAEEQISDIELAIEETESETAVPPIEETMLTRAVWQLGKEQQELYRKLWKAVERNQGNIQEILAPQGDAVYMVRIPGTGRIMITISGEAVSVTNVRSQEKERYSINDMTQAVENICPVAGISVEDAYRQIYDEELETQKPREAEKDRVAPVQPKTKKAEPRKQSKVTKARTEKTATAAAVEPEEEQLPGQMDVSDYEGVVPEARYEEIKEEKQDGKQEYGMESGADTGNIAGVPNGAGTAGDAVEPGTDAGETGETESENPISQPDESHGTTESGGREADNGAVGDEEEIWMEIRTLHQSLSQYLTVWADKEGLMESDVLDTLHNKAISLAAGLERVMMIRSRDE